MDTGSLLPDLLCVLLNPAKHAETIRFPQVPEPKVDARLVAKEEVFNRVKTRHVCATLSSVQFRARVSSCLVLSSLNDFVADRVVDQVAHCPQAKLAHDVGAMGLRGLD